LGGGKNWTEAEEKLLFEMVQRGMNAQQIYDSGMFPNRTFRAILNVVDRTRIDSGAEKEILLKAQIGEAEIIGLDSVVKRYVDAFNKVCDLKSCNKEDLERFRIIFSSARAYFEVYYKFQKYEEVERRVERVEKLVAQLAAKKNAEDSHTKLRQNGNPSPQPPV
jgi:hypothetical protein